LIHEYRDWLTDIQTVIDGKDESKYFLSEPAMFQNMANVHALMPGPDWIEGCLVENKRVRIEKRVIKASLFRTSIQGVNASKPPLKNSQRSVRGLKSAKDRVRRDVRSLVRTYSKYVDDLYAGLSTSDDNKLYIDRSDSASIICSGYEIWHGWASRFLPASSRQSNYGSSEESVGRL